MSETVIRYGFALVNRILSAVQIQRITDEYVCMYVQYVVRLVLKTQYTDIQFSDQHKVRTVCLHIRSMYLPSLAWLIGRGISRDWKSKYVY